MFDIKFDFILLFIFFHVAQCQRRIINGSEVTNDKTYVVYLVKATISEIMYDTWLCGGALVTKEFIITSAACVEDVDFLYAIAGYKKYVTDKFIPYDECTKNMKKKIVYTCVPVAYQFSYDEIEKWSYIDIALVKVESPYEMADARYQVMCSYIPSVIHINYDIKRQAAGVDAMTFGWGHPKFWRKRSDKNNYNLKVLHYTSVLLMDKEVCKKEYNDYPELVKTIDKYMICTLDSGNIDDKGEQIEKNLAMVDGCVTKQQKLMGFDGVPCVVEDAHVENNAQSEAILDEDYTRAKTRKKMSVNETNDDVTYNNITSNNITKNDVTNKTEFNNEDGFVNGVKFVYGSTLMNSKSFNRTSMLNKTRFINRPFSNTRRNGICQNDHGGPLITWVGSNEMLIGIASVFKITDDNECVGPFLYTSTMCNGAFISCVLTQNFKNKQGNPRVNATRQGLCDSPASVRGFDTIEKYVSWKMHPAGPAENEINTRSRKKKKGFDKFATNTDSEDKKKNDDPLSDRHTKKVKFPNVLPNTDLSDRLRGRGNQNKEIHFAEKIGPPILEQHNENANIPTQMPPNIKNIENVQNPTNNVQREGNANPAFQMRLQRPLQQLRQGR